MLSSQYILISDLIYRVRPLLIDDKRDVFQAGERKNVLERVYAPVRVPPARLSFKASASSTYFLEVNCVASVIATLAAGVYPILPSACKGMA